MLDFPLKTLFLATVAGDGCFCLVRRRRFEVLPVVVFVLIAGVDAAWCSMRSIITEHNNNADEQEVEIRIMIMIGNFDDTR